MWVEKLHVGVPTPHYRGALFCYRLNARCGHGTYPYVTSSNTVASSAATGSGCGPNSINYVLGITKAYTTRVGEGPFPTELTDDIGELLGTRGKEFGTVTSRKRRCGWFDGVLVRQTIKISGIDGIALTKLDVLDELDVRSGCLSTMQYLHWVQQPIPRMF